MEKKYKKSAVDLTDLALGIIILGIVVSIGSTVLINMRDNAFGTGNLTVDHTNIDFNLSNQAATGLLEYGNWFTILVIVGISAVVLGLIFLAFGRKSSGSGGVVY